MPQFTTRDGELVQFSSRRDPIVPAAHAVLRWLASRWFPILLFLVNVFLLVTSRWGVLTAIVAIYVLVRVAHRAGRVAAQELARWSVDLGRIDRYRSQSRSLSRADTDPLKVVGSTVRR